QKLVLSISNICPCLERSPSSSGRPAILTSRVSQVASMECATSGLQKQSIFHQIKVKFIYKTTSTDTKSEFKMHGIVTGIEGGRLRAECSRPGVTIVRIHQQYIAKLLAIVGDKWLYRIIA